MYNFLKAIKIERAQELNKVHFKQLSINCLHQTISNKISKNFHFLYITSKLTGYSKENELTQNLLENHKFALEAAFSYIRTKISRKIGGPKSYALCARGAALLPRAQTHTVQNVRVGVTSSLSARDPSARTAFTAL